MKNSTRLTALVLSCAMISFSSLVRASDPVNVGSPAPVVEILDQDGQPFDLAAAYASGTVLVYFYPKADTPGCTAQACSLRDDIENLGQLNVRVIGVSRDTPAAQKRFQERHNLPFTLLADEEGKLATAFGVGGILGFSNRSSFLIRDGKIVWVQPRAKTSGHAEEVLAALAELDQAGS